MTTLSTLKAVESHLFVRIQVDQYKSSGTDTFHNEVLKFSDKRDAYTINGEEYLGLGKLVSVTASNSELRSSSNQVSVTISGIPQSAIAEILNSKIKGSPLRIYRVLFDPITGEKLDIATNPLIRYRGFISNYTLQEDYDVVKRTATNTILLVCSSSIDMLNNKYSGRKTNPECENKYFPADKAMDRVPTLQNSTFNFGMPKA